MVAENGGWSAGWLQDMGLKASMVRSWKARKRVPKPWELVLRDRLARPGVDIDAARRAIQTEESRQ